MKIGWATPLHQFSAIGRFSVGVTQALAERGVEIDLLRTEREELLDEPRLASNLKTISLAGWSSYDALRSYDLLVCNIGNNAAYHHHAVAMAMQIPAICIFHDMAIFHLFSEWMDHPPHIAAVIDGLYGPGTYAPPRAGQCHLTKVAMDFPMLEWLAPHALAAVAHGHHYMARLLNSCAGPVRHIPLAYDLPHGITPPRIRSKSDLLRLTTIGHINENKLCAEIIRTLGASRHLREQCTYRLAGPISGSMRKDLGHLAMDLGVALHMTGQLSASALTREIEDADAILCLRRPVLEGASASAIEAMLSGRPTIVLDHGFYLELPEDLTLKLPPDFELAALGERISWLLDHPEESRALGRRAASWASDTFSFSRYADGFLQLAEIAPEAEPLMRLGTQLGKELLALGVNPGDPLAGRVAQMATDLFCPEGKLCRQI
jgi:glycosyltransferase involved in cell wall biosynthesis